MQCIKCFTRRVNVHNLAQSGKNVFGAAIVSPLSN
jgi:hypothetical protein